MKKLKLLLLLISICFIVLILVIKTPELNSKKTKTATQNHATQIATIQNSGSGNHAVSDLENMISKISSSSSLYDQNNEQKKTLLILNANNFEEFVHRCMQFEPCKLNEDPWKLYQFFKREKKNQATEILIAYLRFKLLDPEFKTQYKYILEKMIDDFYPPGMKEEQMAQYYYHLGDYEKALELYLDLKKKAERDPQLKKSYLALNLANVYFDLKRFREALPYYKAAHDEMSAQSMTDPNQVPALDYVRNRIDEIDKYLNDSKSKN